MASLLERAAASIARLAGLDVVKAAKPKTEPPYATALRASGLGPNAPKRGAKLLRNFSENNEWVRAAINRRKSALAYAKFNIVRTYDPDRKGPDPKVVQRAMELFQYVNDTRESFHALLKKVVEDILVLDAGCVEKVRTIGGDLVQLVGVDGATIQVNAEWEANPHPYATRYIQYDNFVEVARLRNEDLIYMMHNPRTSSPIGWSPVETLVRAIEAELYADRYDADAIRQNMPDVLVDFGPNITKPELTALREYYETEIAGERGVFFYGGGPDDPNYKGVSVHPFVRSGDSVQREAYKKYLATKIAAVFEIDLTALGLVENVNRSTSKTGQEQSDRGLVGLARTVEEFVTREIIWELDEGHSFEFDGIVPRDELTQAKIDQVRMQIGVTFPNEIRARDGLAPVEWGDYPYNSAGTQTPEPLDPDEAEQPEEPDDQQKTDEVGRKAGNPFGVRRALRRRIALAKTGSTTSSTR